jgi:hypothetical protein
MKRSGRSTPSSPARGKSGDSKRLDDLKETLAILSGLEARPGNSINIWA